MKSGKGLKRLAIVLFIALCGSVYFYKAGGSEPVITEPEPAEAIRVSEEALAEPAPKKEQEKEPEKVSEQVSAKEPDIKPKEAQKKEQNEADGLVNLNTAGESELCTLPGIGQVKAQRIIKYREENGPFKDIGDIKRLCNVVIRTILKAQDLVHVVALCRKHDNRHIRKLADLLAYLKTVKLRKHYIK